MRKIKCDPVYVVKFPHELKREFLELWLIEVSKVDQVLAALRKCIDPKLRCAFDTVEMLQFLSGGIAGRELLTGLVLNPALIIETGAELLFELVIFIEVGLIVRVGRSYHLALPPTIKVQKVRDGMLALASTEDEEWLHPEALLVPMSRQVALEHQAELAEEYIGPVTQAISLTTLH